MTQRPDGAADEMELRVCLHGVITNEEGADNQITDHSFTLETELGGRSMDDLFEFALQIAKDTFWIETTLSLGITVSFIRQVHAEHT
ncbi:MAG: hypothetical protein JWQ18_1878 [Conexibacter sp.]|nr:hypothetical protein [Conexibacter sp.]